MNIDDNIYMLQVGRAIINGAGNRHGVVVVCENLIRLAGGYSQKYV